MIKKEIIEILINKAYLVALNSYSPYSKFRVGAALLARNGKIITGTNIENKNREYTICAERAAIASAVSSGIQQFDAVCVIGIDCNTFLNPCESCINVLKEFNPNLQVITVNHYSNNDYCINNIGDIIPEKLPVDRSKKKRYNENNMLY